MTLVNNSYGNVDLLASATDLDKRVTALEENPVAADMTARVEALEAEFAAIKAAITAEKPNEHQDS